MSLTLLTQKLLNVSGQTVTVRGLNKKNSIDWNKNNDARWRGLTTHHAIPYHYKAH